MKPNVIPVQIALSMVLSSTAFGQASFQFITYNPNYGVNARVFDADGQMLVSTNYLAELWGGASSNAISPLRTDNSANLREILPFNASGYVLSTKSLLSVLNVPPYGWAWLQMRAWDANLGVRYEDVAALNIGGYGESPMFYAQGNDPTKEPPDTPAPLIGLQSFSLRAVVPEPSTWALLALGGVGLWLASRRWSQRCL